MTDKHNPNVLEKVKITKADITTLEADAIVNSAFEDLLGGDGVDGAIHEAAGPLLLEACRELKGCEIGKAKITSAFRLPARYVIHTVGPVWEGGHNRESELLASCYKESLAIANAYRIKKIAFPAISTGVFGYPIEKATPIAFKSVIDYLQENSQIEEVTFVTFSEKDFNTYTKHYRYIQSGKKIEITKF